MFEISVHTVKHHCVSLACQLNFFAIKTTLTNNFSTTTDLEDKNDDKAFINQGFLQENMTKN